MKKMVNFKVICINDAERPDGIPTSKWVVKGQIYTVIEVGKLLIQGGRLGFKLAEINIDSCFPYQFFSAHRFAPVITNQTLVEDELERLLEEAKEEFKEIELPV